VARRDDARRRIDARNVGTWRRLVLAHGPARAIPAAMMIAELAHALDDGALVSRPTHDLLGAVIRSPSRTVRRALHALVSAHWLERVGPRAMTGTAQEYRLRHPPNLPAEVIAAAKSLRPGMWDVITGREQATDGLQSDATVGQNAHDSRSKAARQQVTSGRPTGFEQDLTGCAGARAPESAPAAAQESDDARRSSDPAHVSSHLGAIKSKLGMRDGDPLVDRGEARRREAPSTAAHDEASLAEGRR